MRTGFDCDRQAFGACGVQFLQSESGRKMDYVKAKAILTTESDHQVNGFELCLIGARGKIRCIPPPIGIAQRRNRRINRASQLCMYKKWEARLGDEGKCCL